MAPGAEEIGDALLGVGVVALAPGRVVEGLLDIDDVRAELCGRGSMMDFLGVDERTRGSERG